ncbi:MAG: hypothetical protein JWM95_1140 [Gemmatimonadetes bacterium]|nr:hypothetical protein [Gemmatimonadota bacterium]
MNKLSACVLVIGVSACSGGSSSPQTAPAPVSDGTIGTPAADAAPSRNRDLITQQELQAPQIAGLTVLEAVKSLRPQFLTDRGKNTTPVAGYVDGESGKVMASIDGARPSVIDDLSGLRAGTVKEVRFLNIAQAHQKFGGAAREGPVVLVTTM